MNTPRDTLETILRDPRTADEERGDRLSAPCQNGRTAPPLISDGAVETSMMSDASAKSSRHKDAQWMICTYGAIEFDIWFKFEGYHLRASREAPEEHPEFQVVEIWCTGAAIHFDGLPSTVQHEIEGQCRAYWFVEREL